MAKRRRLTPANPLYLEADTPAAPMRAAPIADVAREAAATAALDEVSQTLTEARQDGRMVLSLPLGQIQMDYLVRDRVVAEEDDLQALMASIQARGQQAPIEVVELAPDRYGLISGWRRCYALERLAADTKDPKFDTVLALLRRPAESSDAYQSMVEENELRVGLSYYERARIVAKAVEMQVFEGQQQALRGLFATASRAKRSKIGSFTTIVSALDDVLRFPQGIAERQGLALAQVLAKGPAAVQAVRALLAQHAAMTPEAESAALDAAIAAQTRATETKKPPPKSHKAEIAPGITFKAHSDGRVTLGGEALTEALRADLIAWLQAKSRAKTDPKTGV